MVANSTFKNFILTDTTELENLLIIFSEEIATGKIVVEDMEEELLCLLKSYCQNKEKETSSDAPSTSPPRLRLSLSSGEQDRSAKALLEATDNNISQFQGITYRNFIDFKEEPEDDEASNNNLPSSVTPQQTSKLSNSDEQGILDDFEEIGKDEVMDKFVESTRVSQTSFSSLSPDTRKKLLSQYQTKNKPERVYMWKPKRKLKSLLKPDKDSDVTSYEAVEEDLDDDDQEWEWMKVYSTTGNTGESEDVKIDGDFENFWKCDDSDSNFDQGFEMVEQTGGSTSKLVDQEIYQRRKLEHVDINYHSHSKAHKFGQKIVPSFLSPMEINAITEWTKVQIPTNMKDACSSLKNLIRKGVPDSKRAQVWQAVSGCLEFKKTYKEYYSLVTKRVFGSRLPNQFYQIPQFGGQLLPADHCLSPEGVACAGRVLWALVMENPDTDFVPVIPDLVCILLTFLNEEETYVLTQTMLDRSKSTGFFFFVNNKQLKVAALTFKKFVEKYLPRLHAHMLFLDVPFDYFVQHWFCRLFVGALPYNSVLRIFDCYLLEGRKFLYRIGLAILRIFSARLLDTAKVDQFKAVLQQGSAQLYDCHLLIKSAYRVRSVSHKRTQRFDTENRELVTEVCEPEYVPYYLPKMSSTSAVMNDVHLQALWSLIPGRWAIMNPKIIFSTDKNGFSLSTLLLCCEKYAPVFLLIQDSKERVFGGFSTQGIRLNHRNEQYYGTNEDFVFTLAPNIKKFGWLAGQARQYVRVKPNKIIFGDSTALVIDEELWQGTSERSKTFDNDPLCAPDTQFECVRLEVYAFV
eukprot:CAMPEP_0174267858 /NCGR_PEP_ID=MMETSP0439-20130205/35139_1 /TAXON_ID=0 /ORGANISM="Stereomyxa ramosa, Strain Chinc5" /LENGTH=799 /DNA_ID=CAMNT_0015355611 /DNA_START=260 /DNA_END=2655 /DNA_ORIENTATION=-